MAASSSNQNGKSSIKPKSKANSSQQNNKSPSAGLPSTTRATVPFKLKELREINAKLIDDMNPCLLSAKVGSDGEKIIYCDEWKLVKLANEIFGFNGWSHSVTLQTVDYMHEHDGLFDCGVSGLVKVQLRDGTFHEALGYGEIKNACSKGEAFKTARKEAASDGLKEAFGKFGQGLGNCLEDPEYVGTVFKFLKNVSNIQGFTWLNSNGGSSHEASVIGEATPGKSMSHGVSTQTEQNLSNISHKRPRMDAERNTTVTSSVSQSKYPLEVSRALFTSVSSSPSKVPTFSEDISHLQRLGSHRSPLQNSKTTNISPFTTPNKTGLSPSKTSSCSPSSSQDSTVDDPDKIKRKERQKMQKAIFMQTYLEKSTLSQPSSVNVKPIKQEPSD